MDLQTTPAAPPKPAFFKASPLQPNTIDAMTIGFLNFTPAKLTLKSTIFIPSIILDFSF
jgi:hypothetical protein